MIDYYNIIEQMKKGEPTYLKDGAIWDKNTMPRKGKASVE